MKFLINKSKIVIYLGLLLISVIIISTSAFNPFKSRIMDPDSSIYVSIAQGVTRGQVLYRELADNKGPLTYFISVPGLYIGGLTGIWITELFIIFISIIFIYKIALLFSDTKTAFLTVIFTSLAMMPYFHVNAGTEEYSLPFLLISLYIFSKHYIKKEITKIPEIILLGICFSCSIMIRLNMFPLWAGFCFIILIEAVINKKYLDLLKYILSFSFGIIIVFIPIYIYLRNNNAIDDFYYNVILGGVTRGFRTESLKNFFNDFYNVVNRGVTIVPFCVGIIWFIIKYNNFNKFYIYGFLFSYFLSIIFLSFSSGNPHYNLVLIPFFVPAIAFLSNSLLLLFSKVKYKYLALIIVFCVIFSEGIVRITYYLFFNFDSSTQIKNAGKIIDEYTEVGDTIINLGWIGYIYPYTKREYASKYIFQGEAFDHLHGAREEFVFTIKTNKPKIITIFTAENDGEGQFKPGWHEDIYKLIETDYSLISDEHGFNIFLRN